MGGTFNPPHIAHLICAEEVYELFKFDKALFIPCARPPHKNNNEIIDANHRYNMTILATEDNPHFEVSRIELDRPGRSYTIETVKELKQLYGSDVEIYWIVGADAILEMPSWKNIDKLLEICSFIGINRPGYDISYANEKILKKIHIVDVTNVDISSSDIRQRIRQGKSIKYLVPSSVESYIYENGLYK
ncbi:TPA: nicotinate-nucleotide adenylyltransferase [Candidatus Poribacteria bacterium]|nr:nicotinate-nucleotide adenylyltransferase [Candidatus Poribacteria bacterium]